MGVGIEAYQIPKYHFDSSFVLKNPSSNVLFSLEIVALPEIMTLPEQDLDWIEVNNWNDVRIRTETMKLKEVCEDEVMIEVEA